MVSSMKYQLFTNTTLSQYFGVHRGIEHYLVVTCFGRSFDSDELFCKATPQRVEELSNEVVVDVICGSKTTVAFTSSGKTYFVGKNGHGVVDNYLSRSNVDEPPTNFDLFRAMIEAVPRIERAIHCNNVVSISIRWHIAAFVTESGELYTWGDTWYKAILGHGDESPQSIPKRVDALSGICCKGVSCSDYHTVVVTRGGRVYTFGDGSYGQLGHGDKKSSLLPTLVQALEATDIEKVQCGECSTIALTKSGYVYAWGNLMNDLLDPSSRKRYMLLPCIVKGLQEHNVIDISCFYRHYAVMVDPSPSAIRQAQRLKLNNKQHSDVTFMVQEKPIYGSIDVLSGKSKYFEAMFRSNTKESIERLVVIPDVSQAAFLKLLEYLCLDNFSMPDNVALLEELVVIADMYLLEGLVLLLKQTMGK